MIGDELRARLLRSGMGILFVKVGHTFLGFALAVVLARNLGPEGYGIYAYVFALVSVLSVPAGFGLPPLVMRETAKAEAHRQWGLIRGLWTWAAGAAMSIALILSLIAGLVAWFWKEHFTELQLATFTWALILVPLIALGNLRGAALRGLCRVVQGALPESVLRPGIFLILVAYAALPGAGQLTATGAMALHVIAAAVAFAIGAWLLRRARPPEVATGPPPVYKARQWLTSALPLGLVAGMQMINSSIGIIILGLFTTADDVGVFRVVVQGTTLVALGLQAVNLVVAPQFARLYALNEMIKLQRLVMLSARLILVLSVPVALLFVLFGDQILAFAFGAEFAPGYLALLILTLGQLVNSMFGSVGTLLNMAGHERDTARAVTVAAIANLALSVVLIPVYGVEGAALASACALFTWNLLMWQSVRCRIGLNSLAFGQALK